MENSGIIRLCLFIENYSVTCQKVLVAFSFLRSTYVLNIWYCRGLPDKEIVFYFWYIWKKTNLFNVIILAIKFYDSYPLDIYILIHKNSSIFFLWLFNRTVKSCMRLTFIFWRSTSICRYWFEYEIML